MKALRLLWSALRHPDLPYVLGWHRRPSAARSSASRAILVAIESAR